MSYTLHFFYWFTYEQCCVLLTQKTRKVLAEKIAQLNSAIDDVSSQLKSEDTPNGAALNTDEVEATAWNHLF